MVSPVLESREVVKRFNAVNPVNRAFFTVKPGEFFTLLGPSGCGKTTILRLVADLEEPEEDEILIDSVAVAVSRSGLFVAPGKRRLGMGFQFYAIWPHHTVFKNLALSLRIRREPAEEIRQRVRHAAVRLVVDPARVSVRSH